MDWYVWRHNPRTSGHPTVRLISGDTLDQALASRKAATPGTQWKVVRADLITIIEVGVSHSVLAQPFKKGESNDNG